MITRHIENRDTNSGEDTPALNINDDAGPQQTEVAPEPPRRIPARVQIKRILRFVRIKTIFLPILFIFVFTLTPSTYDAMMYFYMNELGFDYEFMGRMQLSCSVGMMVGIFIYSHWLAHLPFKFQLVFSTITVAIFNMIQLMQILRMNVPFGVADSYLSIFLTFMINLLGEFQLMPILIFGCKLCPRDLEAAIYDCILGVHAVAYMVSYRLGGTAMSLLNITAKDFSNLWILAMVSALLPLLSLLLLVVTPIKTSYKEEFEQLEREMKQDEGEAGTV